MPFSQYFAQQTLNWFRNQAVDTPPSVLYVSLHTADPAPSGTVSDVTTAIAGGRGALAAANLSTPVASSLPGGGFQSSNTVAVQMTASALAPAVLTHFGLWNSVASGSFLAYGALTVPVTVSTGDVLQFPIGQLIVRSI